MVTSQEAIDSVVKITGNKITFANMEDNIDFDASPLIYGTKTLEELGGDLLNMVVETACGKQTAADAAQPQADPTQAYLDTVDVDYAYDLALKLEDIRSNETLGYRTAGSDAELATGDMLKAEMERIGLQNVTKDAFTLDTQDSLFGLSRRCIPSWVSRAHPSLPSRKIYHFIDSLKASP